MEKTAQKQIAEQLWRWNVDEQNSRVEHWAASISGVLLIFLAEY